MFDEMVLYHYILVLILLGVLIVGMIIPFLSSDSNKSIKRIRIYMFVFHGFITTVAFSGLVTFIFGNIAFSLKILIMLLFYIIISFLESMKYFNILKNPLDNNHCRAISVRYGVINILLILILIFFYIK